MNRVILTAIAGLSLVACGPEGQDNALDDNTITAGVGTLNAGATIDATWGSGITSRSNNAGETVTVNVDTDVKDDLGNVIIPAGATVDLLITQLSPATNRGQADGKFSLSVTSTSIHGVVYPLQGEVTSVPHSLKDRGVGTAEVAKVGVGAAVGAVAGQVIGRDTKATVIGGAVGAVGGAAVAVQTASRDVVVNAGAPVRITLTGPFTVSPH
jgi:hypothetical protein